MKPRTRKPKPLPVHSAPRLRPNQYYIVSGDETSSGHRVGKKFSRSDLKYNGSLAGIV